MTQFFIESVAVCAPGMQDWEAAVEVLKHDKVVNLDSTAPIPPILFLPANERRRTTKTIKLALHCIQQLFSTEDISDRASASVFAACSGDMDLIQSICQSLCSDNKYISPIQFHNCVHNAPAGYWSIASKYMQETTSISAEIGTFSAGMIEAATQVHESGKNILLCCYDISSQPPLDQKRPVNYDFGSAYILSPIATEQSLAKIALQPRSESAVTIMERSDLESIRSDNPSAVALPLLETIANHKNADILLPYLPGVNLSVAVEFLRCHCD